MSGTVLDSVDLSGRLSLASTQERVMEGSLPSGTAREGAAMCIDLRETSRVDVEALMFLLVAMTSRVTRSEPTVLRLPRRRRLRDFLRVWRFQRAVETTAAFRFRELVHPEDHALFGEGVRYDAPGWPNPVPSGLAGHLERQHFFSFRPYVLRNPQSGTAMLQREWARWRQPTVLQLMKRRLAGPAHDIARVVIAELVANAVQHPNARVATVASAIERATPGCDGTLSISIWDNGIGIARTLGECLTGSDEIGPKTIRVGNPTVLDEFHVVPEGWTSRHSVLTSDWTPDSDAHEAELLLASLFPGISRKAAQAVEPVDAPGPAPAEANVGYGLHALYRSVVDDFAGELAIRTGRLSLRLRAAGDGGGGAYEAHLEFHDEWPEFLGNMVTVRIPFSG